MLVSINMLHQGLLSNAIDRGIYMKSNQRKDTLENKETLNFLITITQMLNSSNAILGRNDEMFALDTSKFPKLLINENADLGRLFIERKLVLDHCELFGVMSIVTAHFTDKNILFCDIADSLSPLNHNEDENYPFHKDVRNWFLSIPYFSEKDKVKYEAVYKNTKNEISELMQEHIAIFSLNGKIDMQDDRDKLH